jgi:hypothetical protein
MEKSINYLARSFDDYRSELLKFSNQYYPELSDGYNDSSVGSWFIDLVSAVGDNLSYHIDRTFNETTLSSANLRSTVLNIARTNGLKVPGPKASICEVELSCVLGVGDKDSGSISTPDWRYAPIVKRSTVLSAGNLNFQLAEDVDFGEQFNSEGYSNRTFSPNRNNNGNITGYTVTKSVLAVNGSTRIFKKTILAQDLNPFMEVVLPDKNIMNVESVIFKETSNFMKDPDMSEFYIDAEEFKVEKQAAKTFRFFEVDSLADQYRFATDIVWKPRGENESDYYDFVLNDYYSPFAYEDYTETSETGNTRTTRYYRGKWKPTTQKFITEFTDNGYLKIIFGSGVRYDEVPDGAGVYSQRMMSNLINNDMLGILPNEGWTMFVLYRVGGGIQSNVGVGAINNVSLTVAEFRQRNDGSDDEDAPVKKGAVLNSLRVTNVSPAVAGKDSPSTEELKYLVKYNTNAQDRCVTVKDYKNRLMLMPPKYGAPFRASVIEENNKILMSLLGMNADGKLTKALPDTLVSNIIEYMSHYKNATDYLEIRSGRIYNIGFAVELFISKSYDAATVVSNVVEKIKEYMSVNNHDMGEDIFVGDIEKEITLVDGVIAIIDMGVYSIFDGEYSSDRCPFPEENVTGSCAVTNANTFITSEGAESFKIDLNAIDRVLYSDFDSLFEILKPQDIQIKIKAI